MRTNTHGILSDQLEVGVALTWHWTTLRPPCTLLDVSVYPCGEHHMEVSAHSAHDQSRVSCAAHYAHIMVRFVPLAASEHHGWASYYRN